MVLAIRNPVLQWDPQTVGDPVGVGVVADDLNNVEDVNIREALCSETLDVVSRDTGWGERELHRVAKHGKPLF